MQKPKSINELLKIGGARLSALKDRSEQRNRTLEQVRASVPAQFAEYVVTAGIEDGRLTIGVTGASWAARLRYVTDTLRSDVGLRLGVTIERIRIKVVPPPGIGR
jgi:hypothetical protein